MTVWGKPSRYAVLGYDVWHDPVTASTASVKAYLRITLKMSARIIDQNNTFRVWGNWKYSGNIPIDMHAGESKVMVTLTTTVNVSTESTTRLTFGCSFDNVERAAPTLSGALVVPRRPYSRPNPVTNVTARGSESSVSLSWKNNPTSLAPYTALRVFRWNDGDNKSYSIASLSPSATSYIDSSVKQGFRYQYYVRAVNSVASVPSGLSAYVAMPPLAPQAVVATKADGGVLVEWETGPGYNTGAKIYDNGELVGTVGPRVNSFLVPNPDETVTHTYVVRNLADQWESVDSRASQTIQLLARPYAPTNLGPDGTWEVTGSKLKCSWQHNPADTTGQTAFEFAYRADRALNWVTEKVTSRESSHTIPFPSAGFVEWRVRTWAEHPNLVSPWSEIACIYFEDKPVASIGNIPSTVDKDWGEVRISSNKVGLFTWEAELLNGDVVVSTGSGAVNSNPARWQLNGLQNGVTYKIRARVRSYVWSDWVEYTFKVVYAAPPAPQVVKTVWDKEDATIYLQYRTLPDSEGRNADWVKIEKTHPDGSVEVLVERAPIAGEYVDYAPNGSGLNAYRLTAVTTLGTRAMTTTRVDTSLDPIRDVFITSIDGRIRLRARWDPEVGYTSNLLDVEAHHFLGRKKPVLFTGTQTEREISVKTVVMSVEEKELLPKWEELSFYGKPVLYRDPSGMYMWCAVGKVDRDRDSEIGSWDISLKLTEVERG